MFGSTKCLLLGLLVLLNLMCGYGASGSEPTETGRLPDPKLTGDKGLPGVVSLLIHELGGTRCPHLTMNGTSKPELINYVEATLGQVAAKQGLRKIRMDRPCFDADEPGIGIRTGSGITFEAERASFLKIFCLLLPKANIEFGIRSDGMFVLDPPKDDRDGLFMVKFLGDENGQETFQIEERRGKH